MAQLKARADAAIKNEASASKAQTTATKAVSRAEREAEEWKAKSVQSVAELIVVRQELAAANRAVEEGRVALEAAQGGGKRGGGGGGKTTKKEKEEMAKLRVEVEKYRTGAESAETRIMMLIGMLVVMVACVVGLFATR